MSKYDPVLATVNDMDYEASPASTFESHSSGSPNMEVRRKWWLLPFLIHILIQFLMAVRNDNIIHWNCRGLCSLVQDHSGNSFTYQLASFFSWLYKFSLLYIPFIKNTTPHSNILISGSIKATALRLDTITICSIYVPTEGHTLWRNSIYIT